MDAIVERLQHSKQRGSIFEPVLFNSQRRRAAACRQFWQVSSLEVWWKCDPLRMMWLLLVANESVWPIHVPLLFWHFITKHDSCRGLQCLCGLSHSFISVTCDVGLPRLPVQILKTHPSSLLPYPTLVDRVIESDMVKLGISAIDKYKAACCLKGMKQFDQSMSHWDWYFHLSAQ